MNLKHLAMIVYTFIKENKQWQFGHLIPAQQHTHISEISLHKGLCKLLDIFAKGKSEITVLMDVEPFSEAYVLEHIYDAQPAKDGGYYRLRDFKGRIIMLNLWLSDIDVFGFGDKPEKIFVKAR